MRLLLGILLYIIFLPSFFASDDNHTSELFRIDCFSDSYVEALHTSLPKHFFIKKISYTIDFYFDKKELMFLSGLQENRENSIQDLLNACFYLKQVDQFKDVFLVVEKQQDQYSLEFVIKGHMIFSGLIVSGFAKGKDVYKNDYLLDSGEVFNDQKHKHSIERIQKSFYSKGYCSAKIVDRIKNDIKRKKIVVSLALIKGSKFFVKNSFFTIDAIGSVSQSDMRAAKKRVNELLEKKFKSKVFSQELLKSMKKKIRLILERHGFMNFDISVQEVVDYNLSMVDVEFLIALEQKKEIIFFGNHFFSRHDLLEHLLMYGKSSWHFPHSIIIDEIKQLYRSKGFWDTAISIREENNRLFCLINEGGRTGIETVVFKDNEHFSAQKLIKSAFKQFLQAKFFDKDLFKSSLENLVQYYKRQGFWDIKIIKEEFVKANSNNLRKVIITLDEGKQKKIDSCVIKNYEELENQGPFSKFKKEKGSGFDPNSILEQKQWLLRYFKNKGYSKVSTSYKLEEVDGFVTIFWTVLLQEKSVTFGKTLIKGSSVVPSSSILKEVTFNQGEEWDKSKIEKTLKQLRELDVFDFVQVYPSKEVDINNQKPVCIKVVDADRYELRTRMGLQQVGRNLRLRRGFTYKIGGTFLVRNPFFYADRFVFDADLTKFYRDFAASYHFPSLFEKSIRCQYKLYDTLYNQPVYIGSKNSLYESGQRGFLFNMTKSFSRVTTSGTLGVEFMGIKEADQPNLDQIIEYDKKLLGIKTGYVFLEPNFIWQKLDNILNPRKGHLSFLSCKGMIDLDTKTSFFKVLLEHSFYLPFTDQTTVAIRLRGGHIFNRLYEQIIPIERFYLGGANSLRGYERDYCPPLGLLTIPIKDEHAGLPKEANDIWRYAPQGGRTMLNINTEFRFSLYKDLGGVLFSDAGILCKDSVEDLQRFSDAIVGGSGCGFRYNTPIGPLRFDIGIKWRRMFQNFESTWAWYLTLGHAF